jgi:DNA relaxase NicK
MDNIIVIQTDFKSKETKNSDHVHIRITGQGCRFLEQKYSVTDLRKEVAARFMFKRIKVSRMDICADYDSKFVNDFYSSAYDYGFTGFKSRKIISEFSTTIYLGSKKSEKFFRLYEKDKESGNNDFKDRIELVLKNDYATYEFENENDIYNILSSYMEQIVWINEEIEELWQSLQGSKCEISPKLKHKKSTLKQKVDYILSTFGKTLRAFSQLYGTKEITKGIHYAVMSPSDFRLIRNQEALRIIRYKRKMAGKIKISSDKLTEIDKLQNLFEIQQKNIKQYEQMVFGI